VGEEELYKLVFNNSEDLIFIFDLKGKIIDLNKAAYNNLNYTKARLLKVNLYDIISKETVNLVKNRVKELINTRNSFNEEVHLIKKDKGGRLPVKFDAKIIRFNGSKVIISYSKKRAIKKQKSKKLGYLSNKLASSSYAVAFADLNGNITYINSNFLDLWGYANIEEVIGKPIVEFYRNKEDVYKAVNYLKEYGNWMGEIGAERKNGESFTAQIYSSIFLDFDGKPIAMIGIASDVTKKAQNYKALKRTEERYKLLFDTMTQGVVYHNKNGEIILANPTAEKVLGINREEMVGKNSDHPIWKTIREDGTYFPPAQHPVQVSLRTGRKVKNVIMGVYNPLKSEYRWININSIPLFKPDEEEPYQVYAIFEDITESKKAKDALKRNKEKLKAILDAIPDLVVMIDNDFRIKWINDEGTKLFGADLFGKHCFNAFHQRNNPCMPCIVKKTLEDGELHENEKEMKYNKNNKKFYYWCTSNVMERDPSGNPKTTIEVCRDITARREFEKRLEQSEKKYREMAELLPDAIVELDKDLNLNYINPAGLKMFGYTPQDFEKGLHAFDLLKAEEKGKVIQRYSKEIKGNTIDPQEFLLVKKDDSEFYARVHSRQIYKNDKIIGIRTSISNIDALVKTKEKLKFYKDLIAHDITNVLNNINSTILLTEYGAKNKVMPQKMRNMLDLIRFQVDDGINLLANVQKISEIENKTIKLKIVNPLKILDIIIESSPISKKNNAIISINNPLGVVNVKAGSFLKDAFEIIIINGIKHNLSEKKYMIIEISKCNQEGEKYIKFDFMDNGIGVPDILKEKIFDREHRSNLPSKGMGIGLSLVKRIIKMYKGRIWVKDNHPKGSIFTVLIPSA